MRHNIAFGKTGPLLTATGMPRSKSFVDIDDGQVTVEMGWAFRSTFSVDDVSNVEKLADRKLGSIGVHGWAGSWLVNGALTGLVAFDIEPATTFKLGVGKLKLRRLTVSLEDPDAFIADLEQAATPAR